MQDSWRRTDDESKTRCRTAGGELMTRVRPDAGCRAFAKQEEKDDDDEEMMAMMMMVTVIYSTKMTVIVQ
jgi:hypothetical protein